MRKILIILLLLTVCGCSFVRNFSATLKADDAKALQYGSLGKADVLLKSYICLGVKCDKIFKEMDKKNNNNSN